MMDVTGIMSLVGLLIGFQQIPAECITKLAMVVPARILIYLGCLLIFFFNQRDPRIDLKTL